MDNTLIPAYSQQLTTRFWGMFFLALLPIVFLLFLFWQNNQSLEQFNRHTLPALQQQAAFQKNIIRSNNLISQILTATTAKQYSQLDLQLSTSFQQLMNLDRNNSIYKNLLSNHYKQSKIVNRLVEQSDINQVTKDNARNNLNIILTSLKQLILEKQAQQKLLYQQISQDKISDRVTASRARAHAKVIKQLLDYQQLQQLLSELLTNIQQLSLQSSLVLLEKVASNSEHIFLLYDELLPTDHEQIEHIDLQKRFVELEGIFLNKEYLLAKWRGQLRLVQQYHQYLRVWQQQLNKQLAETNQILKLKKLSSATWLQNYFPELRKQTYVIAIITLSFVFIMVLLWLVLLIRKKLVNQHSQLLNQVEQILAGDMSVKKALDDANYLEEKQFFTAIKNIQAQQFNVQDYKNLQAQNEQQTHLLAQQQKVAFWCLPQQPLNEAQSSAIKSILQGESEQQSSAIKSWRSYFSDENCQLLLTQAKLAKQHNCSQLVEVETNNGIMVEVTLSYQKQQYIGSLVDISKVVSLRAQNRQLSDEILRQYQEVIALTDQQQHKLINMLVQAMLQAQSISLDSGITLAQLYRLLTRINERAQLTSLANEQVLLNNNNNNEKSTSMVHPLRLIDVDFTNEVMCAILNATSTAAQHKNNLYLNYQAQILPLVKLDPQLFQQLFSLLSSLMLAQQTQDKLVIEFDLKDKNSGQQSILISFTLVTSQNIIDAKRQLFKALFSQEVEQKVARKAELEQQNASVIFALKNLFKRLRVENIEQLERDNSVTLQFVLPLALSQDQQKPANIDLKEQHFLLLSNDKIIKAQLDEIIKPNNAHLHHLAKIELLSKQYSIKQLTKQPLAAIILAPDCHLTAIERLDKYTKSLPQRLQPKLMVMQDVNNVDFEKHALHSQLSSLLIPPIFIANLQALLKTEQPTDQLLSAQYCQNYHYQPTQVQALIAVKEVAKHHHLQRLLSWLGMHVTFVANSNSLLEHWKTGRYLVLLTEFEQSPVIKLENGNTVSRGVFSLSEQNIFALDKRNNLAENWQFDNLVNYLDLSEITKKLAPWLKGKVTKTQVSKKTAVKAKTNENSQLNVAEQNAVDEVLLPSNQIINLQAYAKNQGSAELAAYMIDEYLALLASNLEQLEQTLKVGKKAAIEEVLKQLLVIAKIMAAADLVYACRAFEEELNQQKVLKNNQKIYNLQQNISQQVELLTYYAQAI